MIVVPGQLCEYSKVPSPAPMTAEDPTKANILPIPESEPGKLVSFLPRNLRNSLFLKVV